jgi:fibronectin-binding autotransporter adhesin
MNTSRMSVLGMALCLAVSASGAQWTHNTDGNASGEWNTNANWSSGSIPNAADATADFSTLDLTAPALITLNASATVGTMTFEDVTASDNWIFSGGSLLLSVSSGIPSVTVNNQNAIFNNSVVGTLKKLGNGTMTLGGPNSQLTGFAVNGGTLCITGKVTSAGGRAYVGSANMSDPYGTEGANGTLVIDPGADFTLSGTTDDAFVIGRDGNGVGTVTQNGGTFHFTATDKAFFVGAGSAVGVYNLNGGTLDTGIIRVGVGSYGARGTFNLNGGTLVCPGFTFPGRNLAYFVFNGGTLKPQTNSTTFFQDFTQAKVSAGGAIFDVEAGHDIVVNQSLADDGGGLVKKGVGMLTLNGVNTYSGYTQIQQGALKVASTASCSNSTVSVLDGGRLQVSVTDPTKQWACNGMVFSGTAATLAIDFGSFQLSKTAAPIQSNGKVDFTNLPTVAINIGNPAAVSAGQSYPLMTWDSMTGTAPAAFSLTSAHAIVSHLAVTGNTLYWVIDSIPGSWVKLENGDASGDWFTVDNWNPAVVPNRIGDVADFSAQDITTDSTVTVSAPATVGSMSVADTVPSHNWIFNGSPIAFEAEGGTAVLAVNNQTATMNNDLTGGFRKEGDGELVLAGDLTLTNGFAFNKGKVRITGKITSTGGRAYIGSSNADDSYFTPEASCDVIIEPGAEITVSRTSYDNFVIGRDGGRGTLTQNGGTFTYSNSNREWEFYFIGADGITYTSTATNTLNGGLLDLGNHAMIVGGHGSKEGVFNLNGGVLKAPQIGVRDVRSAIFNFNGGTLKATGDRGDFFSGLTSANVQAGGAVIDTDGHTVTIAQPLLAAGGGLTKKGEGALVLSGACTYDGITDVQAGALYGGMGGSCSATTVHVAAGAAAGVYVTDTSKQWSVNNMTFDSTDATLMFNFGTIKPGTTTAPLNISGTLDCTVQPKIVLMANGSLFNAGDIYPLMTWSSLTGTLPTTITVASPHAVAGHVTVSGSTMYYVVESVSSTIRWGVNAAGVWDTATANWRDGSGNTAKYLEVNSIGDKVLFDDSYLTADTTVTLDSAFHPYRIDVNNALFSYTVNGTGSISDSPLLFKRGAKDLTLGVPCALKALEFDGGTLILNSRLAVNGVGAGSHVWFGNGPSESGCRGNLILNPGSELAMWGAFDDALVLGRDSGSCTVVQNGGSLNLMDCDVFIGASRSSATRSEYYLNDGVMNIGRRRLTIGFGSGTLVTGVLWQAGGIITNVNEMPIGMDKGIGFYTLAGGTLYSRGLFTWAQYDVRLGGGRVVATEGWSSSLNMTLTNLNGSVTFDSAGKALTLTGILSGNGGLVKAGEGSLTLTAVNSYSGATAVNGGSLLVDGTAPNCDISVGTGASLGGAGKLVWKVGETIQVDGTMDISRFTLVLPEEQPKVGTYVIVDYTNGALTGDAFAAVPNLYSYSEVVNDTSKHQVLLRSKVGSTVILLK